jgi:hypothetical protein
VPDQGNGHIHLSTVVPVSVTVRQREIENMVLSTEKSVILRQHDLSFGTESATDHHALT